MAEKGGFSRRDFLAMSSAVAATQLLAGVPAQAAPQKNEKKKSRKSGARPNILFVFSDQERLFDRWPVGYHLPGHERMARTGTTFTNHQISATMCTSSRAVILTGLQTPDNRMFENVDMPYVKPMSPQVPTIGHMLRKAGYYTAYKGKWHLNEDFNTERPEKFLDQEMDKYGFSDFFSPGDLISHTLGGYEFDHLTSGSAITWLRRKGRVLSDENKPWSLFVSLVNPHDIMYFNADAPGENIQDNGKLLMRAARAPEHKDYRSTWKFDLPTNLRQPIDQAGRPKAHAEFLRAWDFTLGKIPLQNANWNRFNDYYFNSIRAADADMFAMLNELDALGLSDNTIVVFTSDHGEMAGAHGLRGKGPFAYRESVNVPLYIVHPDVQCGQKCQALTSHIDLVPTLLSMAGVEKGKQGEFAGRDLPGKDINTALNNPAKASLISVRDKALFTYSGIATNDSEMIRLVSEAKAQGKNPMEAVKVSGYKPDLKKRGSLRSVYDGRYRFTRYFSPMARNSPQNLDELWAHNDVELFDLKSDPQEMKNLAIKRGESETLVAQMNQKLEDAIRSEIGKDDGREMPEFAGIDWALDRMDL